MVNMNRYLILIFIVALALRLFIVISSSKIPDYDASGYDDRAMSIIRGEGFGSIGKPTAFKEPFYSFFLAGVYYIFGHSYLIVRIAQAILSALICIFITLISKEFFSDKTSILAGLIAVINPSFIKASEHLLSETLFTFILILAVFYAIRLTKRLSFKTSIMLGILFGVGALTRSTLAPLAFLISVTLFFLFKKRYAFKKIMVNIIIIVFFFLLPIAPWTIRNWLVFHEFVPISTNVGINIYSSYFPPKGYLFGFTASDNNTEYAKSLNSEPAVSKYLLQKSWDGIKKLSPTKIFKLEVLKFLYFLCPFDWEIIGGGRFNFVYGFIFPFFIFGMFVTLKKFKELFFIYLPIIYAFFIALITYGSPRFRLPIEPYLIIIAATGITYFICHASKKIYPSLLTLSYLIFNFYFYLDSYYIKIFIKRSFEKIFPYLL